jgi:colanic acid/amylovoran biosynthesis glycosyltransferase
MKIAFAVGKFPVLSETFILNQITGLIDRGHSVDILALNGPPSDPSRTHPEVEAYRLLGRTYYFPARLPAGFFLPVFNVIRRLAPYFLENLLRRLRSVDKILSFGAAHSYDVIHCQFGTTGLKALRLLERGIFKGRLVVSFRGGDISKHLKQRGVHAYDSLFQVGDFFLTNCDYFKHLLIGLGCPEEKLAIHRSGIDCGRFSFSVRKAPLDGRIRIVTTARLVPKKGLEYGIRAVAKLLKIYPGLECSIIGDGPLRADLEKLIRELNIEKSVKLLGQKRSSEVAQILDRSHLFIAPSITSDEEDIDGPVNTLKEAMAMGLPVVATRHGGIPELVEDGVSGFLVPERDADATCERLNFLIHNPNLWSAMGRAGRAKVEASYDRDKLNDELVEIYSGLLAKEPRGLASLEGNTRVCLSR